MNDLGYANDWKETPEIVLNCEKENHKKKEVKTYNCVYNYSCEICDYNFNVDSGD